MAILERLGILLEVRSTGGDKLRRVRSDLISVRRALGDVSFAFGVASAAITAALGKVIANTGELAREVRQIARVTGVSTTTIQQYGAALQRSGGNLKNFDVVLRRLADRMNRASLGQRESVLVFNKLGIAVRDTQNNLRPLDDILQDVGQAFRNMPNYTDKATAAQLIFGRSSGPIIEVLSRTSEEISKQSKLYEELGEILTEQQITAWSDFADRITDTNKAMQNAIRQAFEPLMPLMRGITIGIQEISKGFREFTEENPRVVGSLTSLVAGFTGFGAAMALVLRIIIPFASASLIGLGTAMANGTVIVAGLTAAFIALKPVMMAVAGSFVDLGRIIGRDFIQKIRSEVESGKLENNLEVIGVAVDALINSFAVFAKQATLVVGLAIIEITNAIKGMSIELPKTLKLIKNTIDMFGNLGRTLAAVGELWLFVNTLGSMGESPDNLKNAVKALNKAGQDTADSYVDLERAVRDVTEGDTEREFIEFVDKLEERFKKFPKFSERFKETFETIRKALSGIPEDLKLFERGGAPLDSLFDRIQQGFAQFADDLQVVEESTNKVFSSMSDSFSKAIQSMILEGASWKDAMKEFANQVLNSVVKLSADLVAKNIFTGLGGGVLGLGGTLSSGASALASPQTISSIAGPIVAALTSGGGPGGARRLPDQSSGLRIFDQMLYEGRYRSAAAGGGFTATPMGGGFFNPTNRTFMLGTPVEMSGISSLSSPGNIPLGLQSGAAARAGQFGFIGPLQSGSLSIQSGIASAFSGLENVKQLAGPPTSSSSGIFSSISAIGSSLAGIAFVAGITNGISMFTGGLKSGNGLNAGLGAGLLTLGIGGTISQLAGASLLGGGAIAGGLGILTSAGAGAIASGAGAGLASGGLVGSLGGAFGALGAGAGVALPLLGAAGVVATGTTGALLLRDAYRQGRIPQGTLGGSMLGGVAGLGGSSYVGATLGGYSGIAGGAALGATYGSVVPVLGTIIGAGVGALVGALGGGERDKARQQRMFGQYMQGVALRESFGASSASDILGKLGVAANLRKLYGGGLSTAGALKAVSGVLAGGISSEELASFGGVENVLSQTMDLFGGLPSDLQNNALRMASAEERARLIGNTGYSMISVNGIPAAVGGTVPIQQNVNIIVQQLGSAYDIGTLVQDVGFALNEAVSQASVGG